MKQRTQVDRDDSGTITEVSLWDDRFGWTVEVEESHYKITKLRADQFDLDGKPFRYSPERYWTAAIGDVWGDWHFQEVLTPLMGKRRAERIVAGFAEPKPEPAPERHLSVVK